MKFFLDENIQVTLANSLRAVYRTHQFVTIDDEDLRGTLDHQLFPILAERGFDAIITKDKQQHRDLEERRALYDANLHWIGHQMKPHSGLLGLALESATVVAGLHYVLQSWHEEPYIYTLKGVGAEPGQRYKISRTRMDSWSSLAS